MKNVPPRQAELLDFLQTYAKAYGISPSFREMRVACDISSNSFVWRLLKQLEDKALIARIPMMQRCIELAETDTFHLSGCNCDACAAGRHAYQVQLIQAIQNNPPACVLGQRATNFRTLPVETRARLLCPPARSGRRVRATQPAEARQ